MHRQLARVTTVCDNKYLIRAVRSAWTAFRTTLFAACPHVSEGLDMRVRAHRRAAFWVASFQNRLLRISNSSGTPELFRYLKDLSHKCRTAAVYGPKTVKLPFAGSIKDALQNRLSLVLMGRLGRALPATGEILDRAYLKHRKVLDTPSASDLDLSQIERNVYTWALRRARRCGPGTPSVASQSSASCTTSVRDGGQAKDMEKFVVGPKATITSSGLNRRVMARVPKAWEKAFKAPRADPPTCRAVALAERGAKARVVTCMEVPSTIVGHAYRDIFWPLIDGDNRVDLGHGNDPVTSLRVMPGQVIVSTDLTSATDYALFEVGEVVWRAIISACLHAGWKLKDPEKMLKDISWLLGSHRVLYPNAPPLRSKRGWLMGQPLTWMTLCAVHHGMARGVLRNYVLRGDDLIGVGKLSEVAQYRDNIVRAGFVINQSKTFVSEDAGVFAERFYTVVNRHLKLIRGDFSLKSLIEPTYRSIANVYETMEEAQVSRKAYKAVARALLAKCNLRLIKPYMRKHIPWFLPRALGGLGLLDPKGLAHALQPFGGILIQACLTAESIPPMWAPESKLRAWNEIDFQARRRTKKYHAAGDRLSTWTSTQRLRDSGALLMSIAHILAGGKVEQSLDPKPSIIASRMRSLRLKCLRCSTEHGVNFSLWSMRRIHMLLGQARSLGRYETSFANILETKLRGIHATLVAARAER